MYIGQWIASDELDQWCAFIPGNQRLLKMLTVYNIIDITAV